MVLLDFALFSCLTIHWTAQTEIDRNFYYFKIVLYLFIYFFKFVSQLIAICFSKISYGPFLSSSRKYIVTFFTGRLFLFNQRDKKLHCWNEPKLFNSSTKQFFLHRNNCINRVNKKMFITDQQKKQKKNQNQQSSIFQNSA